MKIIILGAGQVGSTVAQSLASEDNDVTVVDTDAYLLQELHSRMDIRTVCGHASHPDVLRAAGGEDTDMIIAATSSDETNIVAIQVAYSLFGTPAKIARIRSADYLREENLFTHHHIPIDVLISPEDLVTSFIQRIIEHPGALQVVDFSDGKVRMVGVEVQKNSQMDGKSITQMYQQLNGIDARVVAVYRGEHATVPNDQSIIQAEDIVYFLGQREHTSDIMSQFHQNVLKCKRVMIAGGGNIGLLLAKKLEHTYKVKVIEIRDQRAEFLANSLSRAMVLHGDVANQDMLIDENIHDTDVFCALTNDDEANILSSMLTKHMGVKMTMSLINRLAYVDMVEGGIIDVAISPRQVTIGALLTHIRRGDVAAVHSLRKGEAEALEGIVHGDQETSKLVGRTVAQIPLPDSAIIGAVVRGEQVYMVHHDTVIESKDHLIVLVTNKQDIPTVEKLFQVGFSFV